MKPRTFTGGEMTITDTNGETVTLPVSGGTFGWGTTDDTADSMAYAVPGWGHDVQPTFTATITHVRVYGRPCQHCDCPWLTCVRQFSTAKALRKRDHRRARQERKAKRGWS